jgi:hypothetical protein
MSKTNVLLIGLFLFAAGCAVWLWYHPKEKDNFLPGPTYTKTVTKWKLKNCTPETPDGEPIPEEALPKEPDGSVKLATTDTPPAPYGGTLTTYFTFTSGITHGKFEKKAPPLLEVEDAKEIGYRFNGVSQQIYGRWSFFRVGSFHLAAYGQVSESSYLGCEVSYRW